MIQEVNKTLSPKEYRQFGIILALFLATIFGIFFPFIFNQAYPRWPWLIAIILLIISFTYPNGIKPVYRIWMKFGNIIGWLNTRILLGIIFYCLIFPIGLTMRLFGYDPMQRKLNEKCNSYWNQAAPESIENDMEKPY